MGPGVLSEVLKDLPKFPDPNLLVGFDTSDDACVYRIREDLAVIQTVDFFPPIVDDPYLYGQIAAANALSDVYAMGGSPSIAMNLLCFPNCLPVSVLQEILRGGYSKVKEAGAIIAGGHTIEDEEPKYGLCVSGFINPAEIWANSTAKEGDLLILTKPIGSGVVTTAAKADLTGGAEYEEAVKNMAALNKYGRDAAAKVGVNACTDVTGFGLLGHASEMADGSGKTIELFSGEIPLLAGAAELAKMGIIPQGAYKNMDYLKGRVRFKESVPVYLRDLMADPQTSGGLLFSLPADKARELLPLLEGEVPCAKIVGQVLPHDGSSIRVI